MRHRWNAIWSVCRGRLWASSDLDDTGTDTGTDGEQQSRHASIDLVVARLQMWAGI